MTKSNAEPVSKTSETDQTQNGQGEPKALFADVNVTMKTGHLTQDAVFVSDGKFVKLRLATNKNYADSQGDIKTITSYFNALVSANLKDAYTIAKGLKKGDWIYIKGEDRTKSFDTPEGYKQTASTIFAHSVTLRKAKTVREDAHTTPK